MGHWTGLSVRRGPRPPTVVPPVEDVAADTEIAACRRHVPADLLGVPKNGQTPIRTPDQVLLTPHSLSHRPPLIRSPDCQQPQSVLELDPDEADLWPRNEPPADQPWIRW